MGRKKTNLLPYEIWRDIPGYEGYYQVSSMGHIKNFKTGHILVNKKKRNGYLYVCLCKDGEQKYHHVHRLVAMAFVPNPNNLPQINHKDECKENCAVGNLEWCDQYYNNMYGTKRDRHSLHRGKPIVQKTLDGDVVHFWVNARQAAKYLGVNSENIWSCLRRYKNCTTAYGYRWEYLDPNT